MHISLTSLKLSTGPLDMTTQRSEIGHDVLDNKCCQMAKELTTWLQIMTALDGAHLRAKHRNILPIYASILLTLHKRLLEF